jgi:glutamine amidotransferase-like uncharacterized protein
MRLSFSLALLISLVSSVSFGANAPTTRPIRVAVYNDDGTTKKCVEAVEHCLTADAGYACKRLTAEQIRDGALKDFDIVVQPGGTGGGQAKKLGPAGREKIKTFIENGGGYLGICAGAYLASSDYEWSLHILNAKVVDRAHWARGRGDVKIQFSADGRERLAAEKDVVTCLYHQGPLLAPDTKPNLPKYESLASFASEIAEKGAPSGVMVGTTAVAASTFGKGRVMAISPHPEQTPGLEGIIRKAVDWIAK